MNFTAFVIDVFVMDWFVINRDYFAIRVCDKYFHGPFSLGSIGVVKIVNI